MMVEMGNLGINGNEGVGKLEDIGEWIDEGVVRDD